MYSTCTAIAHTENTRTVAMNVRIVVGNCESNQFYLQLWGSLGICSVCCMMYVMVVVVVVENHCYVTFRHKRSFKWHCNTIKTLLSIDEMKWCTDDDVRVEVIGHGAMRAFSFRGSTPRHAQTAGDLGFAVQFNTETPWHSAQLRYPRVPRVTIGRLTPSGWLHSSHVKDLMSNTPLPVI